MVLQQEEIIALQQFKQLLIDEKRSRSRDSASDEIYICGVRLELDAIDDRTDVILLKFLRVSDLKVHHAFNKLSHNILWRKKFGIDKLLLKDEDENDAYSNVFGRAFFMSGRDREGHLVWYTVCGAFQDMELYDEAFSDEAKRQRFLKWRIMFIERTMRKLDFRAGGISSIVHVIDMKNFSGLDKTASEAFLSTFGLLSNYYPDFIERQIMINVPWLDLAAMSIINPFIKRRGNRKVVFVGPSKSRDTLLRYIGIEQIPARCEGLRNRDGEFEAWDGATVVILKRATKHSIVAESCKLRCEIKSMRRKICCGVKSKEGNSSTSTSIAKKKID